MANWSNVYVDYYGMDYTITYKGYSIYNEYGEMREDNYMGEIGVARGGTGTIKYLPVVWGKVEHGRTKLLKTRIRSIHSAERLYEDLLFSCRHRSNTADAIELCEHVLRYGRAHRY